MVHDPDDPVTVQDFVASSTELTVKKVDQPKIYEAPARSRIARIAINPFVFIYAKRRLRLSTIIGASELTSPAPKVIITS